MNIVLIGFGNVGQGFATILRDQGAALRQRYGADLRLVGVATRSRGALFQPAGLDPERLLRAAASAGWALYPDDPGLQRELSIDALIQQPAVQVVIEASPSNLETGQPALDLGYAALDAGKHLVLANKGPVVVDYAGLKARAAAAGVGFYFEGTVMAGTPSIRLAMEALAGCQISAVRGILNGTTNYILTQMETGMSYADALSQAQRLGYAEADPTADVDGWDAAGKLIILANALFERKLTFADLSVTGIAGLSSADLEAARSRGERWKLIAEISPAFTGVHPVSLPLSDPLTGVSGGTNALTCTTDLLGDVTLIGAGAGRIPTGFALLADVLALHRQFGG